MKRILKTATRKLVDTSNDLKQISFTLEEVGRDLKWILGISIFTAIACAIVIVTWLIKFLIK